MSKKNNRTHSNLCNVPNSGSCFYPACPCWCHKEPKGSVETIDTTDAEKIAAYHDARASDAEFVNESDPQPGEIVDQEGYQAALDSGEIEEIPAPNIQFVGKRRQNGVLVPMTAPVLLNDASVTIEMPSPEVQAKPFYHPDAVRIRNLFPKLYKQPVSKGEAN